MHKPDKSNKIISLLLAAVLLLSLCGCGSIPGKAAAAKEEPALEKGWYAVLDEEDNTVGYLCSTGKRLTAYDENGIAQEDLNDVKFKWDSAEAAFVIDGTPAFTLEISKKTVEMTVPKKSPLPFDKGTYTLEEIDEEDMPAPDGQNSANAAETADPAAETAEPVDSAAAEAAGNESAPVSEPETASGDVIVSIPAEEPEEDTPLSAADSDEGAYREAVALMQDAASRADAAAYESAAQLFDVLGDFKDSSDLARDCRRYAEYVDLRVGSHLTFGSYEQDNLTYTNEEAIEWIVLDIQDGRALVVSRYVLEVLPYHSYRAENIMDTGW